ncbi:MAG: 50S ribosomal protein L30 [Candidatus Marinimicrobia bacterium]|jgi:large subunit ribosomal protein L30|nr:50S ribosomal protein L30 [Candidatus Neomarinimicrobiota bacterium]MBT3840248.1 50S ribosomal protein L30 [Candidatus Neomarinimicrobiota bacterium]MBT4000256.1 50S ribosomal protein L30 [Candidatus Neomarinimicrobiota bacterium]MBT4281809.1 50S ribosomal protein L30 [Candidatus Neomarinimicrobiota bacterium]MBT4580231.1 50S ribosomal protein L30 [Candidatus Neomarinimicrobiota bacterium]
MAKSKILRITQIKSGIGYKIKAKATLKALGLRKMQQTVEHKDSPTIRGMINVIPYLLKVEEV